MISDISLKLNINSRFNAYQQQSPYGENIYNISIFPAVYSPFKSMYTGYIIE